MWEGREILGEKMKYCFNCFYHRGMEQCLRDFVMESEYSSRGTIYDCNVERSIGGCGKEGKYWIRR